MSGLPTGYVSADPGFFECAYFDGSNNREELIWDDPDEAIESFLDCAVDPRCDDDTLTVYAWTRDKLQPGDVSVEAILQPILERLDDEYGGGTASEATPEMVKAADVLGRRILEEYHVWRCEQTHKAVIDVSAWIREHRPDWLEPSK